MILSAVGKAGKKRKLLVIIDGTEECERALYFAARRAERTGNSLILLHVIAPVDFQHWLGVASIMRKEAVNEAYVTLRRFASAARKYAEVDIELIVREGSCTVEAIRLIEEDRGIINLLLAAAKQGEEGPGPIISSLVSGIAGQFPIPITIVPGILTNERIDVLA